MNRTKLKNYAPQARRDFIQAVTDRAALYGLTAKKTEPITEKGDVVLIAGKPFPKAVGEKRKKLEARIKKVGFEQTMEAMAYTWFNRLVAIRFMEIKGYLDHGFRVLSHSEGHSQPEILEKAQHVDLPGLDKQKVMALKLDGTKEEELYRLLLTAQCNALHSAMPFLFEKIDDETELLLPDNLLHSDSLIRKLVNEIDEEDWQEVEIIGWLYQFYISERKDEVIGKVVASEDIPAATQLFTPNWIVKYLVQNTLGRQWLATYPQSALRQQMEYYIEPAEQTPEVQEQLKAITPTSLNPEELTLLDPACGSGHILVEAYDLFKAIYQERGYRAKDIPALILQKNLFGLEIDDRAAQLAAFALMMKARADDRRIFDSEAKPNVVAIQESKGLNAADITHALNSPINKEDVPKEYLFEEIQEEKDGLFSKKALAERGHVSQDDIAYLLELFENGKTFGSLIQIPPKLAAKLPEIEKRVEDVLKFGDLTHASAHVLKPLLQQARLLGRQYDAVVANPPYMGTRYFEGKLKQFIDTTYPEAKVDLYACFIQRNLILAKPTRHVGMITIPNWMFLSSFEDLRRLALGACTIESLIHNGRGVFGSDFGTCSFVLVNRFDPSYHGVYRRLFGKAGSVATNDELDQRFSEGTDFLACTNSFQKIPGILVAYWLSQEECEAFATNTPLHQFALPRQGLATTDDDRFLRLWPEVSSGNTLLTAKDAETARNSNKKWFPFNKGGPFRRWYGNLLHVINWYNDGEELKQLIRERYGSPSKRIYNEQYYFREGITYSNISIAAPSFRFVPKGCIFSSVGQSIYPDSHLFHVLGFLNSRVASKFLEVLSPTIKFEAGQIANLPFRLPDDNIEAEVQQLVELFRKDWDQNELSWDFSRSPLLECCDGTLRKSFGNYATLCLARLNEARASEERINASFIALFGLNEYLSPSVEEGQVAISTAECEGDIKRLLSYAIGCLMGRYSLDKPGLIYAHSGNQGFDPSQYKTFRADDDGIIPLLETDWGIRDDATNRFVEFVGVAWPKEHLEENLKFVAESLGSNNGEQARETIRRYLATGFYKHHLSMYKKRPIYWLFSSGKQRAFQCLVYLHRYHEGTLARMRTEYVIPLLGKLTARIAHLADEIAAATSSQQRKRLDKEKDTASKQLVELQGFDEKLRHYADQRIKLDLDDGVKVNYGKFSDPEFGDILADVKTVCGKTGEDD